VTSAQVSIFTAWSPERAPLAYVSYRRAAQISSRPSTTDAGRADQKARAKTTCRRVAGRARASPFSHRATATLEIYGRPTKTAQTSGALTNSRRSTRTPPVVDQTANEIAFKSGVGHAKIYVCADGLGHRAASDRRVLRRTGDVGRRTRTKRDQQSSRGRGALRHQAPRQEQRR